MKNKKGFTLIELIAIIVIIAIIALIITPIVSGVIKDARIEANERSIENLLVAGQHYYARVTLKSNGKLEEDIYINFDKNDPDYDEEKIKYLEFKGNIPTDGTIKIGTDGVVTITQKDPVVVNDYMCSHVEFYDFIPSDDITEYEVTDDGVYCLEEKDYKEQNVIEPSTAVLKKTTSSTSTFLDTGIDKTKIESVKFSNVNRPDREAIDTFDVSVEKNGEITLWYTDKDKNGLYEVVVGENGGVIANPDSSYLFYNLSNVIDFSFKNFITDNVTNMAGMFMSCKLIEKLDLSNFNMSNVQSLYRAFWNASKLNELITDGWNASKLNGISETFIGTKIKKLDLSKWNIKKFNSVYGAFSNCSEIEEIIFGDIDTSGIKDLGMVFAGTSKLKKVDIENWDVSNVTTMYKTFSSSGIESLDLSKWDVSSLESMSATFYSCTKLHTLNLTGWKPKLNTANMVFYNCAILKELDVSLWDVSNVTGLSDLFTGIDVTSLDLSKWDVSNVKSFNSTFYNCIYLKELDLSNWDTSSATNMGSMFYNNQQLEKIYVSDLWDTSKVTKSDSMFYNNKKLPGFNSSKLDVSKANYTDGYLTYKARS